MLVKVSARVLLDRIGEVFGFTVGKGSTIDGYGIGSVLSPKATGCRRILDCQTCLKEKLVADGRRSRRLSGTSFRDGRFLCFISDGPRIFLKSQQASDGYRL